MWAGVGKTAQAAASHAALLCFTLLLEPCARFAILLRDYIHSALAISWYCCSWKVFNACPFVASWPSLGGWAPCLSIVAAPLLIAFELLLCIYLRNLRVRSHPVVDLKIVFLPLLAFEAIILVDNFRMCRGLIPGDDKGMSDEAIWETLPD